VGEQRELLTKSHANSIAGSTEGVVEKPCVQPMIILRIYNSRALEPQSVSHRSSDFIM